MFRGQVHSHHHSRVKVSHVECNHLKGNRVWRQKRCEQFETMCVWWNEKRFINAQHVFVMCVRLVTSKQLMFTETNKLIYELQYSFVLLNVIDFIESFHFGYNLICNWKLMLYFVIISTCSCRLYFILVKYYFFSFTVTKTIPRYVMQYL